MTAAIYSAARERFRAVKTSGRFAAALWPAILAFGCIGEASASGLYFDWPVPLLIEQPSVTVSLSGEVDQSVHETPQANTRRDTHTKELELRIDTRGFVYHPSLLLYNLRMRPEFRWRDVDADGNISSSETNFLGYAINTTWLKEKPYTVSLSAERVRTEFSNSLSPNVVGENTYYNGSLLLKSAVLPTTISYYNLETNSTGFFNEFLTREEGWRLSSRTFTENNRTELNIEQAEIDRSISDSSTISEQLRASLNNRYRLGDSGDLYSIVRYLDSATGGRDSRTTGIRSRLTLDHRKNLRTYYEADLRQNDTENQSNRSTTLSTGLTHLLYENLNTSVNLNGSKSDSAVGSLGRYGGGLKLTYTRRIPWGRLRIDVDNHESVRDDRRNATFVSVQDEAYVFEGITTSVILDSVNIDADSIILTDAAGLVVYVLGVDYEVDVLGSSTIITRSSFGGISDDQAVLASYLFAANPPAKTRISQKGFGATLFFGDIFQIYYQESTLDERLIEGAPLEFSLDSVSQGAGAQLSLGRSITRFDYSDMESSRSPRKILSVTETMLFRPKPGVSIQFSGGFSQMELKDTGENLENFSVSTGLGWAIGRRGRLKASAFLRETRSVLRSQEQKGMNVEYQWRYGAWLARVRVLLQNATNEFADDTWDRRVLYFEARRRFN